MNNGEGKLPLRDILTEAFIFSVLPATEVEDVVPNLKDRAKGVRQRYTVAGFYVSHAHIMSFSETDVPCLIAFQLHEFDCESE